MSGPQNAILGSAAVALPVNAWAGANPASLARIERIHASFFIYEGYNVPELRLGALNLTLPTDGLTVGITTQSFGYKAYRDSKLIASIAHEFHFGASRRIALGLSTILKQVSIQQVGKQNAASLSAGILAEPWPRLHLGFSLLNWIQTNTVSEEAFLLGASYTVPGTIRILTALHKTLSFPSSFHLGFEYDLHPQLIFSTRFSSNPYRLALGAEIILANFTAHLLAEKHTVLNWTPGISISAHL